MTRDQIYLLSISGTLEPFSAYMLSFRITNPNPIANTQKICVRYQWPTKTSAHFQKNIRIGFGGLTKPSRRTFMTSVWCRLQFFIPRQILFHLIRWNNTNDIPEKYHYYFFLFRERNNFGQKLTFILVNKFYEAVDLYANKSALLSNRKSRTRGKWDCHCVQCQTSQINMLQLYPYQSGF